MKTNKERLRLRYIIVKEDYIELFCNKQGFYYNYDGDGEIIEIADYFFNFEDIRYDIDNDVRKGLILKWYDEGVEHNMNRDEPQHINYSSYCKGLRYKDLNKKRRLTKSEKEDLD